MITAKPPKRTPPPKTLRFVWDPIFKSILSVDHWLQSKASILVTYKLVPRKKPAKKGKRK